MLYVIFDRLPGGPDSPAQFIELEDENGRSHGPDSGIIWEAISPMVGPDHTRLGPFVPASEYRAALKRLRDVASSGQRPDRERVDAIRVLVDDLLADAVSA